MGNRNLICNAIVINIKAQGNNNSTVSLLTKEYGIIYATLYGGGKSKMRSLVSLWHSGIIYLYDNSEKKQTKISDFDVKNYHSSFSQNLFKIYAASIAAELAIKTKCAGNAEECFNLISGFIDGLDLCTEEMAKLGLIRFLWRFLKLLGLQPDSESCGRCNKIFSPSLFAPESESYYNYAENCFICCNCAADNEKNFPLSLRAINYLYAIQSLKASDVRKIQINKMDYEQLKQTVFSLIENSLESKLNSIQTGAGIL